MGHSTILPSNDDMANRIHKVPAQPVSVQVDKTNHLGSRRKYTIGLGMGPRLRYQELSRLERFRVEQPADKNREQDIVGMVGRGVKDFSDVFIAESLSCKILSHIQWTGTYGGVGGNVVIVLVSTAVTMMIVIIGGDTAVEAGGCATGCQRWELACIS
jgi:hypothetical protein